MYRDLIGITSRGATIMKVNRKFSLLNFPQNSFVPSSGVLFKTQGLETVGSKSGAYSFVLDSSWHKDIGRHFPSGHIYFSGCHVTRNAAYNMLQDSKDPNAYFTATHWFESRRRLAELLHLDFENAEHYAMVTQMTSLIDQGIHTIPLVELQSRTIEVQPGYPDVMADSNEINAILNFRFDQKRQCIIVDATYSLGLLEPNYLPATITKEECVVLNKVIQNTLAQNSRHMRLAKRKTKNEQERLQQERRELEKLHKKINLANIKDNTYKQAIFTSQNFELMIKLLNAANEYSISEKIMLGLKNVCQRLEDRRYLRGFEFTCEFVLDPKQTCVSIDVQNIAYNHVMAKFFDRDEMNQHHFSEVVDTYLEHVFPRILSDESDPKLRHLVACKSLADFVTSDQVKSLKIQKNKVDINLLILKTGYLALLEFFYTMSRDGVSIANFDAYLDNYFSILRKNISGVKFDGRQAWREELRIYASCLLSLYTQQRAYIDGSIDAVYHQYRDSIYKSFKALNDRFSGLDSGLGRELSIIKIGNHLRDSLLANLEERFAWARYLEQQEKSYDDAPINLSKGPGASPNPVAIPLNVFILDLHRVHAEQQGLLHTDLTESDLDQSVASIREAFENCKQYHETYFPSGVTWAGLETLTILESSLIEKVGQRYTLSDAESSPSSSAGSLLSLVAHIEDQPQPVVADSLPKLVTKKRAPKQTPFRELCGHLKQELEAYLASSGNGWFWSRSRKISKERRHTANLLLALADTGIELERAGELSEADRRLLVRTMYDLKIQHQYEHSGLLGVFSWGNRLGNALERVLKLDYNCKELKIPKAKKPDKFSEGKFESPVVNMTLAQHLQAKAGVKKLHIIDGEHQLTEYDEHVVRKMRSRQYIVHDLKRRFELRLLDCDNSEEYLAEQDRVSLLATLEGNKELLEVKESWIKGLRDEMSALKQTKKFMLEGGWFTGGEGSLKSDHRIPIKFFTYREYIDQLITAINEQRVVKVIKLLQRFPRDLLKEKSSLLDRKMFPATCDMHADTALFDLLNQAVSSLERQSALPQAKPYNHKQCVFSTGAPSKNEGQFKEALQFLQQAFTPPNVTVEDSFNIKPYMQESMISTADGGEVDSPRLRAVERLINPGLKTHVSEPEQKFAAVYRFIDREDVNVSELESLLAVDQYPALIAYLSARGLNGSYAAFVKAYFENTTVAEARSAYTQVESERLAAQMASSVVTAAVTDVVTLPSRLDATASRLTAATLAAALAECQFENEQAHMKVSGSPGLFGRASASGSGCSSSSSSLDREGVNDYELRLFEGNRTPPAATNKQNQQPSEDQIDDVTQAALV